MYSGARLRVKAIIKSVIGYSTSLKPFYIQSISKAEKENESRGSQRIKTYMRARIRDKIRNGFLKGEKYKQWLWFIGLWLSGLLAVLFLAKLIKLGLTFLRP